MTNADAPWQQELVDKWHRYCADSSSVDSGDFHTLFHEDPKLTDDQLQDIFRNYDCKDELIKRLKVATDCRFDRSTKAVDDSALEKAARSDLLIKFKLCKASDLFDDYEDVLEFINEDHIENAPLELVDAEEFEESRHDAFYEILNETFSDSLDGIEIAGRYGLKEALYGVLMDDNLVRYVMSAFLENGLDYTDYLLLENANAEYDLTPDKLMIKKSPS